MAVAVGLIPALASWALLLIETTLRVTGSSLLAAAPQFKGDLYIHGVIALSQGFMLSSMVLAALLVQVIDRRFVQAAVWAGIAALLSLTGLIHAYDLTATGVQEQVRPRRRPGFRRDLCPRRLLPPRPALPHA